MTAKRKARGTASRLEALEDAAAQRREAVEAVKEDWTHRALLLLSADDRRAFHACLECQATHPARWEALHRATAHVGEGVPAGPAARAAWAWLDVAREVPEGVPWPWPADPSSFAAAFEAEATRGAGMAAAVPLSLEAQTVGQWAAAMWRFEAALCRVMVGQA